MLLDADSNTVKTPFRDLESLPSDIVCIPLIGKYLFYNHLSLWFIYNAVVISLNSVFSGFKLFTFRNLTTRSNFITTFN